MLYLQRCAESDICINLELNHEFCVCRVYCLKIIVLKLLLVFYTEG